MIPLSALQSVIDMVGRAMIITRGNTSVTAHGYLRHGGYSPLVGSTQVNDATFVFMADGLLNSPLGELRKFDRIDDSGKIYVVQNSRVMKEGEAAVLVKGTCSHA